VDRGCATLRLVSGERWNSSLHAFEALLDRIPAHAMTGLDVGCGEGETARRLRRWLPKVLGLDCDTPSVEQARLYGDDITYVVGDLFSTDLADVSFDVVSAVGMLHHVDQRRGLDRLSRLLRPGGLLIVVGLARSGSVSDLARDAFESVALRRHSIFKGVWETPAPKIWPPPTTYAKAESVSSEVLPGAHFRRVPCRAAIADSGCDAHVLATRSVWPWTKAMGAVDLRVLSQRSRERRQRGSEAGSTYGVATAQTYPGSRPPVRLAGAPCLDSLCAALTEQAGTPSLGSLCVCLTERLGTPSLDSLRAALTEQLGATV
jgi:SAM-dependent methyltransferase